MNGMRNTLIILVSLTLVFGCVDKKTEDIKKKLKLNNYNFSHWKRFYHKGLFIYLPDYFTRDYQSYYLNKSDGLALTCSQISIYASIERYDQHEAEDLQFEFESEFDEDKSLMEAVHSNFIDLRLESIAKTKLSISNDMPANSNLNGYFHFVEGENAYDGSQMIYCIATVEKMVGGEKKYFVVQLICPKELAAYVADDFKKTLKKLK